MGNKRYYWFKLYDDFFNSNRIKKLRKIAGGDTYTIIYLKMQLKALKQDGYLYFNGYFNDFYEELASDIDEDATNVRITVEYLLSVGLLEVSEDGKAYYLAYLQNCIGSETASTQRSRECRQRQKEQKALQCNTSATLMQHNLLQCNTNATQVQRTCNVEKEKELELELEREYIQINDSDESFCSAEPNAEISTTKKFIEIVNQWNSLESYGITPIRTINKDSTRAKLLRARLKQYGQDSFAEVVEQIKQSDFLQGKGKGSPWLITFDWVIKPNNYPKVLEGNYKNMERQQPHNGPRNFINIQPSPSYEDMSELEQQLLDN